MTTAVKELREGSTYKRTAILQAARELFLSEGFDRTSVDAIALRAGVSKRTLYDYYGDKHTLLLAVMDQARESMMESLQAAFDAHLSDEADIADAATLEHALVAFALQVSTTTISSSDYAVIVKLGAALHLDQSELHDQTIEDAPERAIAERLAHFGELGLLDVPEPFLAAEHFKALTFLLAYENQVIPNPDTERVTTIFVEGTRAFIRAYARRSHLGLSQSE